MHRSVMGSPVVELELKKTTSVCQWVVRTYWIGKSLLCNVGMEGKVQEFILLEPR
jgi:hypothetical protein